MSTTGQPADERATREPDVTVSGSGAAGRLRGRDNHVVFIDSGGQGWRPASDDPAEIDFTVPSPARMYDYYLGGKDHFPADREAAEKALSLVPSGRDLARANRDFLVRVVTYLADQGIDQFIDVGTGLPTSPNVHEAARSVIPDAKVIYVDNDPLVMAHARAMLADSGGVIAVAGDARHPLDFIGHGAIRELIDFSRPVGVLFVAVLHFITDDEKPHGAVAWVRDRIAPGSYLAVSHITSDGTDPAAMAAIQDAYKEASAPAVFRDTPGIARFLDGFDLVQPGLAEVSRWRNPAPAPAPAAVRFFAAIGRKPW
jgi:hypothetical protein